MRAFCPEKLPVYAVLVREFAVFNLWSHPSILGLALHHRLFIYSATSHGVTNHVKTEMAQGYPQRTIFDALYNAGLDFGIYAESIPSTFFFRNLRKLKYAFKFYRFGDFKEHARRGRLRSLSMVDLRYSEDGGCSDDGGGLRVAVQVKVEDDAAFPVEDGAKLLAPWSWCAHQTPCYPFSESPVHCQLTVSTPSATRSGRLWRMRQS